MELLVSSQALLLVMGDTFFSQFGTILSTLKLGTEGTEYDTEYDTEYIVCAHAQKND